MAQTGYTPIQLYYSTTTSNVPSAGNLASGELAINITDGKLFYKDNGGVVRVIAQTSSVTNVASISFGTTGLTPSTATTGAVTVAGTLATTNGGTGLTSFTANRVFYASSTSAIGQSANLTFDGTTLTVNNLTDSSLTSGRVTYATTGGNLTDSANLTFDGTNLTLGGGTANGVAYLNGSKVLTTGSALSFNGTRFTTYVTSDTNTNIARFGVVNTAITDDAFLDISADAANNLITLNSTGNNAGSFAFQTGGSEQMRLTSTGLGIGTSSPVNKLSVSNAGANGLEVAPAGTNSGTNILSINRSTSSFTTLNYYANDHRFYYGASNTEGLRLDSSGNLGLGVTPSTWGSGWVAEQIAGGGTFVAARSTNPEIYLGVNAHYNGSNWIYKTTNVAAYYAIDGSEHKWYRAASGTAGNAISFTQAMTLDASGQLALGSSTVYNGGGFGRVISLYDSGAAAVSFVNASRQYQLGINSASEFALYDATAAAYRLTINPSGFTQPLAYADTVSALGNTGTAKTIDLRTGNVFTATLTGNCTFTLSNAIATGSSSFTLILTNDGTAGRTVAWAGGSFVFPGGAASLSRTTTANAVDVWVFFTPNGGTTWYGNIAMKDMKA